MATQDVALEQTQIHLGGGTSREEQIRLRAHEIWLERGGRGESELTDWLQAEEEIDGGAK